MAGDIERRSYFVKIKQASTPVWIKNVGRWTGPRTNSHFETENPCRLHGDNLKLDKSNGAEYIVFEKYSRS